MSKSKNRNRHKQPAQTPDSSSNPLRSSLRAGVLLGIGACGAAWIMLTLQVNEWEQMSARPAANQTESAVAPPANSKQQAAAKEAQDYLKWVEQMNARNRRGQPGMFGQPDLAGLPGSRSGIPRGPQVPGLPSFVGGATPGYPGLPATSGGAPSPFGP